MRKKLIELIIRIATDVAVSRDYHTSGGICRWGDYNKHFDYCNLTNCPWLQARKRLKDRDYKEPK